MSLEKKQIWIMEEGGMCSQHLGREQDKKDTEHRKTRHCV